VGIASMEPNPAPLGVLGPSNARSLPRLDFKLPEGYKDKGPIFCPRFAASQDNFKGEDWCAGLGSIPIGYMSVSEPF